MSSRDSSTRAAAIGIGVLLVGVGLLNALKPDLGWRISTRRDDPTTPTRPSDQALMTARVSGVAFAVIGVVLIFVGIVG